jgi:hypothetical protein
VVVVVVVTMMTMMDVDANDHVEIVTAGDSNDLWCVMPRQGPS